MRPIPNPLAFLEDEEVLEKINTAHADDDALLWDIRELFREITLTIRKKNHDYGDSFKNSVEKYGDVAFLVRFNDKVNRLESLLMGRDALVNDEKIEDTLMDAIGYLALFYAIKK